MEKVREATRNSVVRCEDGISTIAGGVLLSEIVWETCMIASLCCDPEGIQ
jgi:hypothetical protein